MLSPCEDHQQRLHRFVEDHDAYVLRLAKDGSKIGKGPFSVKKGSNFKLVADKVPNYLAAIWESAQNGSIYLLVQISHRGGQRVKNLKCFICGAAFMTLLKLVRHYDESKCRHDNCKQIKCAKFDVYYNPVLTLVACPLCKGKDNPRKRKIESDGYARKHLLRHLNESHKMTPDAAHVYMNKLASAKTRFAARLGPVNPLLPFLSNDHRLIVRRNWFCPSCNAQRHPLNDCGNSK